ncbi:hypothetical protein COOONC_15950 [Cooperia oncophora]
MYLREQLCSCSRHEGGADAVKHSRNSEAALLIAYPIPHEAASWSSGVLMVVIFGPIPIFVIYKIACAIHRKMPFRSLFEPDLALWGPRNEENRVRAAAWEKKMNVRLHW